VHGDLVIRHRLDLSEVRATDEIAKHADTNAIFTNMACNANSGRTRALITLKVNDVRSVSDTDILAVRSMVAA
jgi:hypothetical protein